MAHRAPPVRPPAVLVAKVIPGLLARGQQSSLSSLNRSTSFTIAHVSRSQ